MSESQTIFNPFTPDAVVGQKLADIAHSPYSEPEFIREGIGPASFRSDYLIFANGLVLDLGIDGISAVWLPSTIMPGETDGMQPRELIGRRVKAVVRDDIGYPMIIFNDDVFVRESDSVAYFLGNSLLAGRLPDHYSGAERAEFVDYWNSSLEDAQHA